MSHREPAADSTNATQVLRSAFKSQSHAALAMLRQAIERCPEDLWSSRDDANPFWRIAYHTLYYTHLYLQPHVAAFRPWEHHQTRIQDLDDIPAPPEIEDLCELPHRPPQTGRPYTKAEVLEYWSVCEQMVEGVDALNLFDRGSGFPWHRMPKAEHQIMAIRHIQNHVAQLGVRLRETAGIGIDWVRAGRSSAEPHATG